MSIIPLLLWQSYFGNFPMPDNCTYELFITLRDLLWEENDRDWNILEAEKFQQKLVGIPYSDDINDLLGVA